MQPSHCMICELPLHCPSLMGHEHYIYHVPSTLSIKNESMNNGIPFISSTRCKDRSTGHHFFTKGRILYQWITCRFFGNEVLSKYITQWNNMYFMKWPNTPLHSLKSLWLIFRVKSGETSRSVWFILTSCCLSNLQIAMKSMSRTWTACDTLCWCLM